MKNIIKLIAVIVVSVMTLSLFAACNNTPADTKPATTTAADTQTTTAETAKETEKETEAVTTEEVTTEEITTEPETEPVPEVRYDVLRWDFDDASNLGWVSLRRH